MILKLYISLQGYNSSLENARKHNLIYFSVDDIFAE